MHNRRLRRRPRPPSELLKEFKAEDRLRLKGIKQETLQRYLVETHAFRTWAKAHRKSLANPDQIDIAMSQYLLELFEDGAHIWEGSYAVYGYQMLYNRKSDKDYLPGAKKALRGWRKRQPPSMRLPVPEEGIFALCSILVKQGHPHIAVAVILQYHTYMRPSEVITLQHHQLCPPVSKGINNYDQWAIILAPQELRTTTKTGEVDDSILVDNRVLPWLTSLLSAIHKPKHRTRVFAGLTLGQYEERFKSAMAELNVPWHITPHVVRHSGPSNDFYHHRRSITQIQKRGRWASFKSCRRYEKSGLIMQAWDRLEAFQRQKVNDLAKSLPVILQKRKTRLKPDN